MNRPGICSGLGANLSKNEVREGGGGGYGLISLGHGTVTGRYALRSTERLD